MGDIHEIVDRVETLSGALEEMCDFCQMMQKYFEQMGANFAEWANSHGNAMHNMSYKNWSTGECLEWIMKQNDGQFVQYEKVMKEHFMAEGKEVNGRNINQINKMVLQYV